MQLNDPRKKYTIIVAVTHSNIVWRWIRSQGLFTIWCPYSSPLAEVETNNLAHVSRVCVQGKHLNILCRWAKSNPGFWWVITRLKHLCSDPIRGCESFWGGAELCSSSLLDNEDIPRHFAGNISSDPIQEACCISLHFAFLCSVWWI